MPAKTHTATTDACPSCCDLPEPQVDSWACFSRRGTVQLCGFPGFNDGLRRFLRLSAQNSDGQKEYAIVPDATRADFDWTFKEFDFTTDNFYYPDSCPDFGGTKCKLNGSSWCVQRNLQRRTITRGYTCVGSTCDNNSSSIGSWSDFLVNPGVDFSPTTLSVTRRDYDLIDTLSNLSSPCGASCGSDSDTPQPSGTIEMTLSEEQEPMEVMDAEGAGAVGTSCIAGITDANEQTHIAGLDLTAVRVTAQLSDLVPGQTYTATFTMQKCVIASNGSGDTSGGEINGSGKCTDSGDDPDVVTEQVVFVADESTEELSYNVSLEANNGTDWFTLKVTDVAVELG